MTLHRIWSIIIKFFGLYLFAHIILTMATYVSMVLVEVMYQRSGEGVVPVWVLLLHPLILIMIAYLCLFKTEWCINTFQLDSEEDKEVLELNAHRSQLIKIVIIILGGYFIIDGIPDLFGSLLPFLRSTSSDVFYKEKPFAILVTAILQVTIGYCMIAYSKSFVNLVESKRRSL